MGLLENKVAIITGGANGIGAACALEFAKNDAKSIFLLDMDEQNGEKTALAVEKYCKCVFWKTDISDEQSASINVGKVEESEGRVDILFNCAGISSTKNLWDTDIALWNKIMDINVKGTFLYSREVMKIMIKNKYGKIINVSSISGQVGGIRTSPAYAASKAAVIALTKSFAKFGAKHGAIVNAISPGIVVTNMTNDPDFHYSDDEVPLGRAATSEEIAQTVLFLASDMSSYITGQVINVNGGMYLG